MMMSDVDPVLTLLKQIGRIDLSEYRRPMVERRVLARMAQVGLANPDEYVRRLEGDADEVQRLIDTVAINTSSFFRDPIVFETLAHSTLPEIIKRKRLRRTAEIRIWSAGCAAGEEAYSVGILLHHALKGEWERWAIHLFATDIDTHALQAARKGVYPRTSLGTAQLRFLDTYFKAEGDQYQLAPSVRGMVNFSQGDVTSPKTVAPPDSVFGAFDLILCRNLLIYLSEKLQQTVMSKLCRSLGDNGYLVLGLSESVNKGSGLPLKTIDGRSRIYQKLA